MRVLVCPDKFRGTLSAPQAAEAIETGWRRIRPGDELDLLPLADGGEGSLDTLTSVGGQLRKTVVDGPLRDPVDTEFGLLPDGTGIVESARAIGHEVVPANRRDPGRTTTRGVGGLMRAALDAGARRVLVCLGGSVTNDGGAGMARALGARFVGADGVSLPEGGKALLSLASIDVRLMDPRIVRTDIVGLTDVDNPLVGPQGASAVFAPQKGASPDDVWLLDRALGHLAAVVERDLGVDATTEPGAGAAGGLGFGLLVFCGARLRPGIEAIAAVTGLDRRIDRADLVLTGEGELDASSLRGKVVGAVLERASLAGTPAAILCGRNALGPVEGVEVTSLTDIFGEASLAERWTGPEASV
jgi:glycerate kinase